jgi:hypothetical protein
MQVKNSGRWSAFLLSYNEGFLYNSSPEKAFFKRRSYVGLKGVHTGYPGFPETGDIISGYYAAFGRPPGAGCGD